MENTTTSTGNMAATSYAPVARRSARGQLLVAFLAFVLGAVLVGWIVWRGYLEDFFPDRDTAAQVADVQPANNAEEEQKDADTERQLEAVGSVEGRLAMLEDRLSRLDLQANAASGNAARAESLLIAFAARRMIDRGQPLRYLADQIQLRFANAQPRAVRTILEFARDPVTLDQLSARLEALSPDLTGTSPDSSFLDKALTDLGNLFSVQRQPSEVIGPEAAIERARVMLRAGRIDDAVAQVQRLPGAVAAEKWVSDARRYAQAQRALDLIETAAMLEPTRLQDSEGNRVDQPSPLATPTATADSAKPKKSSAP